MCQYYIAQINHYVCYKYGQDLMYRFQLQKLYGLNAITCQKHRFL